MATNVKTHACMLLLLISLGCLAWGKLDLPTVVQVHAGQKTHILCTYTCQEADSYNIRLSWKNPPPEFLSLEGYYNATHHSLKMNVDAGSQEVKTSQIITCVAITTNGTILEEGSTYLEICPTETLVCQFQEEPQQTSPTVHHVCECQYKSNCTTALRCQSCKEESPRYLGNNHIGSWKVAQYEFTALKPEDNVTCRLHSPSIEEHLQTTVELTLPEESSPEQTTQTSTTQALTNPELVTQVPDKETQTYSKPGETSIKSRRNKRSVTCDCDCTTSWVLFIGSMIILVCVCAGVIGYYCCKLTD